MTRMAKTDTNMAEHEAQAVENLRRGIASDSFIVSQSYGAPARKPLKKKPAQTGLSPRAAKRRAA